MEVSKPREFEDGAFYWVRSHLGWTVARYDAPCIFRELRCWVVPGAPGAFETTFFAEIGPCIGKEPPQSGRLSVLLA